MEEDSEKTPLLLRHGSAQESRPINASQESWHGIDDQQLESEPSSAGVSGRTRLTGESSETESRDEPLDIRLLNARLESLDYDNCENELYLQEERWRSLKDLLRVQVARWFVMLLIGILTALVASCIDICVRELTKVKFSRINYYFSLATEYPYYSLLVPLSFWIFWNVALVGIAAVFTAFGEPVAAGSGIPQIKCFLNGIKVPHVVRIKTLFCKFVGVILSVAGGLSIGKEGPMIHSGAVIAAGVSQGRSTTLGCDLRLFEYFRTDTEKRDFVSGGAAAGVSAAFGAPVGGVLFSLEEGASFWNQALTWRIFFASMVSTFTLNIVLSIYNKVPGRLSYGGLINFGRFQDVSYGAEEIPVYVLMGVFGGLTGAAFNFINHKLTVFRYRGIKGRCQQVVEAIMVALSSAMFAFFLIYFDPSCQQKGRDPNKYPLQMHCGDGQSSTMATLWFQSPEETVKSLFHNESGTYGPLTLFLFCVVYFFLACWTYGMAVPSGLFIPGLVIGAAWGRLSAIGCKTIFHQEAWVDPGKFALIGAAAQLGGIVRMTLSLTVILIEATGNISLGLPLMIVLMVAKWTGDLFNEGIYDMHIHMQGVPILDWEPPAMTSSITAKEVMSHPVVTFYTTEKVSTIVHVLKTEQHDGFPVVQRDDENEMYAYDEYFNRTTFGVLEGTITRTQLIVLLRKRHFERDDGETPKLHLRDFRDVYPRFPRIENLDIADEDQERTVDLRPFMNPAPYAVFDNTSMPRIFKLFRGLGLRHLVVVNRKNEVIGIVTRKDLARYKFFRHNGHYGVVELGMATN